MKYFGTYTDNQDLVPKSYVDGFKNDIDIIEDSLNFLYSHTEYDVNVAFRVGKFKNKEDLEYYNWDNYDDIEDNDGFNPNHVELLVDNANQLFRSTSICFNYESNDPELPYHPDEDGFPTTVSDVNVNGVPRYNTIYYVLGFNHHLPIGSDIYLYMRTVDSFITTNKIRVLIPSMIKASENGGSMQYTSNKPVYFNGRYLTTGDNEGNERTRNGYIDLGYSNDRSYSISVTLHIYFDGEYYFIDRYAPFNSDIV